MNDLKSDQWLKEYQCFLRCDAAVPPELSEKVTCRICNCLCPGAHRIFAKIFAIHVAVGFLSLSICHQFGLNPFGTEKSLADWFMSVGGHGFCMIGCGVLFTALSIAAAGYFLTVEEVRVLRHTEFLQAFFLSLLSLGAFAFAGAEFALTFAGLWFLGALIGGFVATEVIWQVKSRCRRMRGLCQ